MVEKNLPYPLNANPTTDEDRYGDSAPMTALLEVAEHVAALENNGIIKNPPTVDGNYVLKCKVSGSKKTYSWVVLTEVIPALPTVAGTYKLTVEVDGADIEYSWTKET